MAIEEIKKLVNVPFNFTSRKIKKTIYVTSDGTEFEKYTPAINYETKYLFIKEFKEYFSEEKNNFIIGTKELNNALWINEDDEEEVYNDFFWVKVNNEKEKEILKKFCIKVYKNGYYNLYRNDDCSDLGWIYIIVISDGDILWISKKQIEQNIQITQNNFPENIKTNKIIKKKVTRSELIDI